VLLILIAGPTAGNQPAKHSPNLNHQSIATMTSTSTSFSTQQQLLANKKHSELTDSEKIYLLKREIDGLRGQINDKEHDLTGWKSSSPSLAASSSSSMSNGSSSSFVMSNVPILSMLLIVMVVIVAVMKRRYNRSDGARDGSMSSDGTFASPSASRQRHWGYRMTMRNDNSLYDNNDLHNTMNEAVMSFELQEQSSSLPTTRTTTTMMDSRPYQAPDASMIQFV
jgi:hypothetical protein